VEICCYLSEDLSRDTMLVLYCSLLPVNEVTFCQGHWLVGLSVGSTLHEFEKIQSYTHGIYRGLVQISLVNKKEK